MANLSETPEWEAGIYRLETSDPVLGGEEGVSNRAAKQLANRTSWLKALVESTVGGIAGHLASTANPHATTKAQVGLGNVDNYATATQAQAEDGTVNNVFMTPLRVAQAIAAKVAIATEAVAGRLRIASQDETDAGTADDRAITPKKLRWGFAILKAANGYLALPSWLGGVIVQWGGATTNGSGLATVTFPMAFPNGVFVATTNDRETVASAACYGSVGTTTTTAMNLVYAKGGAGADAQNVGWFAIGH